ncbi:hypothetical protein D3C72_2226580 [compost metagenome]
MPPGSQHRPAIIVAEQAIRRALHMHHVFGMRADAAQNPEHALDEDGRLEQVALEEMGAGIEVSDIVALDLESCAILGAAFEDGLDIGERIAEYAIA